MLPAEVLTASEPVEADAVRTLVEIGVRAHGVATLRCLATTRMTTRQASAAVDDLVEDGVLSPVRVLGWNRTAFLHREASVPRRVTGRALLSPFDPLVFERRRLEELFGTRYRIEVYTPAHRRVHGYYVLPFLMGERIAARVDLKADRGGGVLLVQAAHHEAHDDARAPRPAEVAAALVAELWLLADWLALADVLAAPSAHGDLVAALRGELAAATRA